MFSAGLLTAAGWLRQPAIEAAIKTR